MDKILADGNAPQIFKPYISGIGVNVNMGQVLTIFFKYDLFMPEEKRKSLFCFAAI